MFRRLFALLILMPLSTAPALAIDSVSVSPPTASVDGNGAGLLTLRWTIVITTSMPGPVTVTSSLGTVTAGSQSFNTGGLLARHVDLKSGPNVIRITERLRLDATAARLIAEFGTGAYQRSFSDDSSSVGPTSVALQYSSTGGGTLSLRNLSVTFDDRSSYRTVDQGASLTALAKVTTSGRGLLEAVWEIAGPDGGFRPLKRLRFSAAGPRATSLESPALPTDRPGQYRLRFRLGGDGEGTEDPIITYVVQGGVAAEALTLSAPASGATLTGATKFTWGSVQGATRYRIDFLVPGSDSPLAGVEVKGASATIKPFTLSRLEKGVPLAWRVTAYGNDGQVLARSAERLLNANGAP